jgi:hypothetical protein
MQDHRSRALVINIAPISFDDSQLAVGIQPYRDETHLRELRTTQRSSHLVRRFRDHVVDIPLAQEKLPLGERKMLRLSENLGVVASLVRESLIQHLHSLGRTLTDFDPITIVSDQKRDLLTQASTNHRPKVQLISVRPVYELAVRVFQFEDQEKPFVGIALNLRSAKRVESTCEELRRLGVSLKDLYVGYYPEPRDPRIRPRFTLLGAVSNIHQGRIELADPRSGFSEIEESQAYPDADYETLHRLYHAMFGADALAVANRLRTLESQTHVGPFKLSELRKVHGYFSRLQLQFAPGHQFRIHSFLSEPGTFPRVQEAAPPTFVFDPSGTKTDSIHYRGLDHHGPFSRLEFTPNKPRICVICQRDKRGRVEQMVRKFLDGMQVGTGAEPFKAGLVGKYRLAGAQTEFFLADNADVDSYRKACQAAIEKGVEDSVRWALALIQIDESFHQLNGTVNPYYVAKAIFLTHQVPMQVFEMETAGFPPSQLAYALNNMALATYSKMGGIPWLLKASPTIAHELVVGLGSAVIKSSRMGQQKRFVGITTIFTGDGNYRFSNVSKAVPFDSYSSELLESLRKIITRLKSELNWQSKEHVRLIFHVFKPFKNAEASAVRELMNELGDFDADFAFLHIAQDHPYVLFDEE